MYGTQLLPPGDGVTREMIGLFDKAMYKKYANFKAEQNKALGDKED